MCVFMCVCPCDVYVPVCVCLSPSLSVLVTEVRSLYWTRSSPKVTNLVSQLALERCLCLLSPAITGVTAVIPTQHPCGFWDSSSSPVLMWHTLYLLCHQPDSFFWVISPPRLASASLGGWGWPRIPTAFLYFPQAGITGIHHHIPLTWCWG